MSEEQEPKADRVTLPSTSILRELELTNPQRFAEAQQAAGLLAASDTAVAGACTAMIAGQQMYNVGAWTLTSRCEELKVPLDVQAVLVKSMRDAAGKPFRREELLMTFLRKMLAWLMLLVVDERVAALLPALPEEDETEEKEPEEETL